MGLRNYALGFSSLVFLISLLQAVEQSSVRDDEQGEGAQDLQFSRDLTGRHDEIFRKYTRTYFGRMPWKWFKAQSIQESNLQPHAKSAAGAMGLMQLMPATFQEIRKEVGLPNAPYDAKSNIHAGIWYNMKCYNVWTESRSNGEILKLMFASYNAGPGSIIRAQKVVRNGGVCDGKHWDCIQRGLPQVTGNHSKETTEYVANVERYYKILR